MQNIVEILKAVGIVPTDEQITEINKSVASNYKTIAEFDKKVMRLETERDGFKEQAETAQATLKGFEGVNLDEINRQIEEYKAKAEDAEKAYNKRIAERDFDEALKAAMDGYKFTSSLARSAVMAEIKGKGLTMVDGKIVGLGEVMDGIKERDKDAFAVEDAGTPPAKFTSSIGGNPAAKKYDSKADILKIKDATERQQAIKDNISLFI